MGGAGRGRGGAGGPPDLSGLMGMLGGMGRGGPGAGGPPPDLGAMLGGLMG
jgi:hypothetical protein